MKSVLFTQAAWDVERMFGRVLKQLEGVRQVILNPLDVPMTEAEVVEACRRHEVETIVSGWGGVRLSEETIAAAKDLKLIAVFGGTVKGYSPRFAMERGIRFCHCPKAMGYCVAEVTVGLMLTLCYELHYLDRLYRDEKKHTPPEGNYPLRGGFVARSLRYARVGLIGSGNIARHVIRMLGNFDCEISVYDPFLPGEEAEVLGVVKVNDLDALLRHSDILSVHAGWTAETEGMLSAEKLSLLPDDALVVCTARMPIFDEAALKREVLEGRLRVGINAIPENPIWMADDVRGVRHLIVTPGLATVAHSSWFDMGKMLLDDVTKFSISGKLDHEVKLSCLDKMT